MKNEELTNKQKIREIVKCRNDINYFAEKYVYFIDKEKGLVQYKPFPFQKDFLKDLCEEQKHIVLKSRQMGFSWTVLIWALHRCLFFLDEKGLILSKDSSSANDALNRIKIMYEFIPDFMKGQLGENNKSLVEFEDTRSSVKSLPMTEGAGRSDTPTFAIWDEMAFPRIGVDPHKVWDSLKPALGHTGKFIAISTPNGFGNLFHKFWVNGKEMGFKKTKTHWSARHDRVGDEDLFNEIEERRKQGKQPTEKQIEKIKEISEWYKLESSDMDEDKWDQEYEMDFLNSGRPVFSINKIIKQLENIPDDFDEEDGVLIFKDYDEKEEYIASFDTAEGSGGDSNSFGIFTRNGEQVLEYTNNTIPLRDFVDVTVDLLELYENPLLIVERNNTGVGALERYQEKYEYENIYFSPRDGKAGFQTNSITRPIMIDELKEMIRNDSIILRSEKLIEELRVFTYNKNGKPEAPVGYHDDRVMMLALYGQALNNFIEPVSISVSS